MVVTYFFFVGCIRNFSLWGFGVCQAKQKRVHPRERLLDTCVRNVEGMVATLRRRVVELFYDIGLSFSPREQRLLVFRCA